MTEAEGRFRERRSAHASETEETDRQAGGGAAEPTAPPAGRAGSQATGEVARGHARIETPGLETGPGTEPDTAGRADLPFPEGPFLEVVQYVVLRASQCLGEIPFDETGEKRFLPREAKAYIDLLAVLRDRTGGDLSKDTAAALANLVSDLRTRYLELS